MPNLSALMANVIIQARELAMQHLCTAWLIIRFEYAYYLDHLSLNFTDHERRTIFRDESQARSLSPRFQDLFLYDGMKFPS